MDNWIGLGLLLLIIGAGLTFYANEQVEDRQSIVDKAERAVSEDAQEEYRMWNNVMMAGWSVVIVGFAVFIWRLAWTA